MTLIILSCAEQELAEAVDFYNEQSAGLGYEFAAEVQRGFRRILENPDAWPPFSSRSRRYLTDRFPFGILYEHREERILIGGIMHRSQDPIPWQNRMKD